MTRRPSPANATHNATGVPRGRLAAACLLLAVAPMTPNTASGALPEQISAQSGHDLGDPLECTPAMRRWAETITAGTTNDLQMAKALFDEVRKGAIPGPVVGNTYRTAAGVFTNWGSRSNSFVCQELAYLYIALARATGLDAHYALVEQDCYGNQDFHACAALTSVGRTNLVDPAYSLFEAPHQRFRILDDVETMAVHLSGMDSLAPRRLACKIAPTLTIVHESLFQKLVEEQNWKEAEVQKTELVRLDPDSPSAHYAEALTALRQGRLEDASGPALLAVRQAPMSARFHALAAEIFARQGELTQAELSARSALKWSQNKQAEDQARFALAYIMVRGRLAAHDWSGVVSNCSIAISVKPDYAEMYSLRGDAETEMGDLESALKDFTRAIDMAPKTADAYDRRGYVRHCQSDIHGAIEDYGKAIQLQPARAETYLRRGAAREDIGDENGALTDYQAAIKLDPDLQEAKEKLAHLNSERVARQHRSAVLAAIGFSACGLIIGLVMWKRRSRMTGAVPSTEAAAKT